MMTRWWKLEAIMLAAAVTLLASTTAIAQTSYAPTFKPNVQDGGHALLNGYYVELGWYGYPFGADNSARPSGVFAGSALSNFAASVGRECDYTVNFRLLEPEDYEQPDQLQIDWSSCGADETADEGQAWSEEDVTAILVDNYYPDNDVETYAGEVLANLPEAEFSVALTLAPSWAEGSAPAPVTEFDTVPRAQPTFVCVWTKPEDTEAVAQGLDGISGIRRHRAVAKPEDVLHFWQSYDWENSSEGTFEEYFFEQGEDAAFLFIQIHDHCVGSVPDGEAEEGVVIHVVQAYPFKTKDVLEQVTRLDGVAEASYMRFATAGGTPREFFDVGPAGTTDDGGRLDSDKLGRVLALAVERALREQGAAEFTVVNEPFDFAYTFTVYGHGSAVSGNPARWESLRIEAGVAQQPGSSNAYGVIDSVIMIGLPITKIRAWPKEPAPQRNSGFVDVSLDPDFSDFLLRVQSHFCHISGCGGFSGHNLDDLSHEWIN